MGSGSKMKPHGHAVLTPFPAQGHINPMFQLAKLLHSNGFHITFVHTEFNAKRLLNSRGPTALDGLPDFRFETIPDGLCDTITNNCLGPFGRLLDKLKDSASAGLVPPVTCLVSDIVMSFIVHAAEEIGVPIVLLWPASAYSFLGVAHYRI